MFYINSLCILIHIVCIFIICSISAILIINPLLISYNLSYTKLVHFILIFIEDFCLRKYIDIFLSNPINYLTLIYTLSAKSHSLLQGVAFIKYIYIQNYV